MDEETVIETREAEVPAIVRSATVSSYRAEDNSVELCMTTGARRVAYDWWNGTYYEEELVVDRKSVNTERLDANAVQLLDSHRTGDLSRVLGVVTSYTIADGAVNVRVKLSGDPAKSGIIGDIRDGIIRNVSFGYTQDAVEVIQPSARKDGGKMPLYRVTRFTPNEVSMVPVPADPHAGSRSDEKPQIPENMPRSMQRCQFTITRAAAPISQEPAMDEDQKRAAAEAEAKREAEAKAERERIAAEARAAEQKRSAEITQACASVGFAARAAEYIRDGLTLDQVNSKLVTAMAERDAQSGGHSRGTNVRTVSDEQETRAKGIGEALMLRVDARAQVTDAGRPFAYMSMLDMGRELLEGMGINTRGKSPMEISGLMLSVRSGAGMMTPSDFPSLMANVANKRLRDAYQQAGNTYQIWARRAPNLRDFKPTSIVALSGAPALQPVNDHGEFKSGSMSDAGVTYQAMTYGMILPFTRQAIINDDLRGFDRVNTAFGDSAARKENELVYAQLTGNPTMSDGNTLFASAHNNAVNASGAAPSVATLSDARKAMRLQKGMAGETLNIQPQYIIGPAALELVMNQMTSNAYVPTTQTGITDFAPGGRTPLTPVVEPLLDASSSTAWYLAASNGQIDTIEYAYVDGNEGVYLEMETGFDVDGVRMKARLDFACRAIDWRGLYRNVGA